jgi:hypothetical protein
VRSYRRIERFIFGLLAMRNLTGSNIIPGLLIMNYKWVTEGENGG